MVSAMRQTCPLAKCGRGRAGTVFSIFTVSFDVICSPTYQTTLITPSFISIPSRRRGRSVVGRWPVALSFAAFECQVIYHPCLSLSIPPVPNESVSIGVICGQKKLAKVAFSGFLLGNREKIAVVANDESLLWSAKMPP